MLGNRECDKTTQAHVHKTPELISVSFKLMKRNNIKTHVAGYAIFAPITIQSRAKYNVTIGIA